ncbi:MAG: ribbon-helix-helix domain-containing protein [Xanthobacteraceae bacterium]
MEASGYGSEAEVSAQGGGGIRPSGILSRVNLDGCRALRLLAIERDTSLQTLAIEAFNDLLAKHGKRPVVSGPLRDEG